MAKSTNTDIVPSTIVFESFGDIANNYRSLATEIQAMDSSAIVLDIVNRINQAETIDDILDMSDLGGTNAESILGQSFTIQDIKWLESKAAYADSAGSTGFYVLMTLEMVGTGETVVLTCGATNVLAQLYSLVSKGLDYSTSPMMFTTKDTANGFRVIWLSKG